MAEQVLVRMYDGEPIRVPKGSRKADVIRRYYMNKHWDHIAAMEDKYGVPAGLLSRLIDRESAFNPRAKSKAGALGLMQIVKKWHPKVDPFNETEAITYGAKYLADRFRQFGDWEKALAAYNWGQGNLREALDKYGDAWLEKAPKETRDYVATLGEYTKPRERTGPINPRKMGTNETTMDQNTSSGRQP